MDQLALARHPLVQQLVANVFESGVANIPTNGTSGSAAASVDGELDFSDVFQLDGEPAELTPTVDGAADFSAAEYAVDGARLCYGVTAVVALADNDPGHSIVVVPSTHKSTLAAPDLRAWDAELAKLHHSSTDELGVTVPVALSAGDLFLAAATLMQSVRGAPTGLIKLEYTAAGSFPSAGPPQPPPLPGGISSPAWVHELQTTPGSASTVTKPSQSWSAIRLMRRSYKLSHFVGETSSSKLWSKSCAVGMASVYLVPQRLRIIL
jgi:hypothetical protein